MLRFIKAGQFRTQCLKIMDEVKRTGVHIVITKRDEPIAELVPVKKKKGKKASLVGYMKGTGEIIGDIIEPIGEEWDACR